MGPFSCLGGTFKKSRLILNRRQIWNALRKLTFSCDIGWAWELTGVWGCSKENVWLRQNRIRVPNGSGVTISDSRLGFRSLVKRDLSGGRVSPPLIRIERAWVGFEGLGKGTQDLCSSP